MFDGPHSTFLKLSMHTNEASNYFSVSSTLSDEPKRYKGCRPVALIPSKVNRVALLRAGQEIRQVDLLISTRIAICQILSPVQLSPLAVRLD